MKIFISLLVLLFATQNIHAKPPIWIDLPSDDYSVLSKLQNDKFNHLNVLVQNYHAINKQDASLLEQRISALNAICNYLNLWDDMNEPKALKKFISNIRDIAVNKKQYLNELKIRFEDGSFEYSALYKYHMDQNGILKGLQPIFLHNSKEYDSTNGQYWGEYWMETIDPCHRQLTTYYNLWRKSNPNSSLGTFFLWLEDENLSKDVLYLNFMSDLDLKSHTVKVKNGLIYFNNFDAENIIDYDDPNQEYIFNIDLSGEIILVPANKHIHHVSISKGKPVLGCGNMLVRKGKIVSIELESGHYLPTIEHGIQTIKILQRKGITLDPRVKFSYYADFSKHTSTIEEFTDNYG